MRNPTIWMNVTTSSQWTRPSVGVVRVETALCEELEKLYPKNQFRRCVWSDGRFVEWQEGVTDNESNSPADNRSIDTPDEFTSILPLVSKRQAVMQLCQAILALSPKQMRPYMGQGLGWLRPRVSRLISTPRVLRLRRWLAGAESPSAASRPAVPTKVETQPRRDHVVQAGDVLISVGLDWDSEYYREFYALRTKHGVRVVTCCYDLIPVLFPQYCVSNVANLFTSYFLDVADGSDLVLCISKQSEKDFRSLLYRTGGAEVATHVFPLGDNVPSSSGVVSHDVQKLSDQPFILFVSTIERRKNHEVLYKAYHLLGERGLGGRLPKLVFVGMEGWGVSDLLKDIELDPLVDGLIVRLNHVNDAELQLLYQASMFCVYPSLYEGWGLPVGEALAMGKVVLSSNRGSLPEVGGDLVRYVDAWNPTAWADEIWALCADPDERRQLEQRLRSEHHARTWHDSAISVKAALGKFLSSSAGEVAEEAHVQ